MIVEIHFNLHVANGIYITMHIGDKCTYTYSYTNNRYIYLYTCTKTNNYNFTYSSTKKYNFSKMVIDIEL